MAAVLKPVLTYISGGLEVANGIVTFGRTQPGSYSHPITMQLWNNWTSPAVIAAINNPVGASGSAIDVSFPDATNVALQAFELDGVTPARFNLTGTDPLSTDPSPKTDWLLEIATYNQDTGLYSAYSQVGPSNIIAASLSGKAFDKTNNTIAFNKSKFIQYNLRLYVPYAATANETYSFMLKATCTIGSTSPAYTGSTNYTVS